MMKNLRTSIVLAVILGAVAVAFPASAKDLKVVASFSIIADFARNVGGDRIELTTLVGPDGDAHVYEPKPADAVAMAAADVVLVNGLRFEGFLQRLVDASATKAAIVELAKGAEVITMGIHDHEAESGSTPHGHGPGDVDPHAFQSIPNAEIYVSNIAEAFCTADTDGCDALSERMPKPIRRSSRRSTRKCGPAIGSIPPDKRVVITSHDAFGYLGHEYGITFLAPEGMSTEAEASAADVAALIRQVKGDKASAIFVENVTDPRLVEQIASETGLKLGGTLFSDALSARGRTCSDLYRHDAPQYHGDPRRGPRELSGGILAAD